ncbi:MAG: hypothetical protein LC802_22765 [Acidobacteria bacterium]|nr:hypothetical protein [Acidobacteriota bacterium]
MSNRFERPRGRGDAGGDSNGTTNMMRLFGQVMLLPFTVFAYGMELFVRTLQGAQRVADDGMDVMVGGTTQTPAETWNSQGEIESSLAISSTDGVINDDAETNPKETIDMNDTDLSDEKMLKLVRYKILFIKRDHEHAFPEVEELVSDSTNETGYTAWKIAEFIQRLAQRETKVPANWKEYPVNEASPTLPYRDGNILLGLPEKDKKFLRVYYEVLARYERESFRYEERQIEVLEEIRNRL